MGETGGDEVGSLAGGRDGGVGGTELVRDASGPQPAGDGASAGGQDRSEEQADETGGGARIQNGGQVRKPVARGGGRRGQWHGRSFRGSRQCDNRHRPRRTGSRLVTYANGRKYRKSRKVQFYTKTDDYIWNPQFCPYDAAYVAENYNNRDEDGRLWRRSDLTGAGVRHGASGEPWRGYDPTAHGRHWASGTDEDRERLVAEGRIGFSSGGYPYLKRYLDEMPGVPLQAFWGDVPLINNRAAEFLGYPTQKPEVLLERIVKSSSNEGATVLDPFCGCGAAVSVSQKLNRRWVGIDITHLAITLLRHRLQHAYGPEIVKTYQVIGEPVSLPDAEARQTGPLSIPVVGARSGRRPSRPDRRKEGFG